MSVTQAQIEAAEIAGDIVYAADIEGGITYVNEAFERLYGFAAAEAVGANPSLLRSALVPRSYDGCFWRDILAGRVFRDELIHRAKSGRLVVVQTVAIPVADERIQVPGFVCVQNDLTGMREIEAMLTDGDAPTLQRADLSSSGYFSARPDGTLTMCDATFRRMFGFSSRDQVLRWNLADFLGGAEKFAAFVRVATASGRLEAYELSWTQPSGAVVLVLATMVARTDPYSLDLTGIDGTVIEVRRPDDVPEFIADAGYRAAKAGQNLTTWPTIVSGDTSPILLHRDNPERIARNAGRIGRTVDRVAQTAGQSQVGRSSLVGDTPRIDAVLELAGLRDLIADLVGPRIELIIPPAEQPLWVCMDRDAFRQVVLNLACNARDAIEGDGSLWLRIEYRSNDEIVGGPVAVLQVADNGIGIPECVRARIFEPFFSTKSRGRGAGLGLTIARESVQSAGGRIEVTSSAGIGTIVEAILPLAAPPRANPAPTVP